jgi:hypothetical protein
MMRPMPTVSGALRTCVLFAAACVVVLKGADYVPSLLAGTPHGARVYWTLADAEAGIGAWLWVPTSYPQAIVWPPSRIDAWPGAPTTVAIHFNGRTGERDVLILVQSIGGRARPPDALLPPVETLMTVEDVPLRAHTAMMARELAPGGQLLHELSWDQGARHLVLRYAGPVEDLLVVAGNLERIHP